MKLKHIVVAFLFSSICVGQIANLQNLSKGKFSDSAIIRDSNNTIKGYFLLFETDKVEKETVELEYVVLDENLTKVASGYFNEMKFERLVIKAKKIAVFVTLDKTKLLLQLNDYVAGQYLYWRYRILDLATNHLSDDFIFNKNALNLKPEFDRKLRNYEKSASEFIAFYNEVGMVVNSVHDDTDLDIDTRYLAKYDDDFKEVWKNVYNNDSDRKNKKYLDYLNSDQDVLVFFNHTLNKKYKLLNDFSVMVLDSKTGKLISEFLFPDMDQFCYSVVDCQIKDHKINLLGNYSKKSEYGNTNDYHNVGLFSFTLDGITGKEVDHKFLRWEDIKSQLDIDKDGYVKKEGALFIHNMLPLSDGRIIVVSETFEQSPIVTNNMYLFELSANFKVNQVFTVDKFRNKFPKTTAHSSEIKSHGLFDFIDYQNLGDDEFLFFLNDNEKNGRNRSRSTLYGIVSYSGGKFKRQTLNLKTETSTIKAYPAKKGYLMLVEEFDDEKKPTEYRLEKIDY